MTLIFHLRVKTIKFYFVLNNTFKTATAILKLTIFRLVIYGKNKYYKPI